MPQFAPTTAKVYEFIQYRCKCGFVLYNTTDEKSDTIYMFCTNENCSMKEVKILVPSIQLPIIIEL